jgi:hypothetical protein
MFVENAAVVVPVYPISAYSKASEGSLQFFCYCFKPSASADPGSYQKRFLAKALPEPDFR